MATSNTSQNGLRLGLAEHDAKQAPCKLEPGSSLLLAGFLNEGQAILEMHRFMVGAVVVNERGLQIISSRSWGSLRSWSAAPECCSVRPPGRWLAGPDAVP